MTAPAPMMSYQTTEPVPTDSQREKGKGKKGGALAIKKYRKNEEIGICR